MRFDEVNNKVIPETEEEQKLFDYAFNKGVGQGKKTSTKVEEPKAEPQVPTLDPNAFAEAMKAAVADAVKPLYDDFSNIKAQNALQMKEKVIGRQQTKLPKAYEALVTGATEAEVKASFDAVLEQYKTELKEAGVTHSFGAPTPSGDGKGGDKPAKAFKDMTPAEKIDLYKADPEAYSKLAGGN